MSGHTQDNILRFAVGVLFAQKDRDAAGLEDARKYRYFIHLKRDRNAFKGSIRQPAGHLPQAAHQCVMTFFAKSVYQSWLSKYLFKTQLLRSPPHDPCFHPTQG
ncbi:uncharacterized protein CLUP02_00237 [Colletotrichum lupini]|uniref:Uncharacterized protein n=1 Tax=Colletotrichum lupini TaxID=145971 RepID=A0A9Q8SBR7_9PEZI|nr:uncharacterized protein CLUP02_00237 [Colletotrichum lupini]UQC73592.1 hypothetical protein CLUP02_00237 [Colletotrichum lupini]